MRELTEIEMARKELEMHVRHLATIARFRILNRTLPRALADFDAAVARGELRKVKHPELAELVAEALLEEG